MKLVQLTNSREVYDRYDFALIDDNIRHGYLKASITINPDNNRNYGWVLDSSITVIIEELE